jgi:hypothetical protein
MAIATARCPPRGWSREDAAHWLRCPYRPLIGAESEQVNALHSTRIPESVFTNRRRARAKLLGKEPIMAAGLPYTHLRDTITPTRLLRTGSSSRNRSACSCRSYLA